MNTTKASKHPYLTCLCPDPRIWAWRNRCRTACPDDNNPPSSRHFHHVNTLHFSTLQSKVSTLVRLIIFAAETAAFRHQRTEQNNLATRTTMKPQWAA